jgi:hypothetical protein
MRIVLGALALAAGLASETAIKKDTGKSPPAKVQSEARADARTTNAVANGEKDKTPAKVPVNRIKVLSVREIPGRCQ